MMDNETFDEVLNGFKEADSIVKRLKTRIAELEEENKKLKEKLEKMEYGNSLAFDDIERICNEKLQLKEENRKLKEENEYRKKIADVLPEGEGHIAEETIQDLQARIKELNEDVNYFRQCYLDLKRLCEKEGFMPSDEEVIKMFNLDKIK